MMITSIVRLKMDLRDKWNCSNFVFNWNPMMISWEVNFCFMSFNLWVNFCIMFFSSEVNFRLIFLSSEGDFCLMMFSLEVNFCLKSWNRVEADIGFSFQTSSIWIVKALKLEKDLSTQIINIARLQLYFLTFKYSYNR